MIAILAAGAAAMLFAGGTIPLLIRWLKAHNFGQLIREDGPSGHTTKAGTPTMGGIGITCAIVVGYVVGHVAIGVPYWRTGIVVIVTVCLAGLVGFIDDYLKIRHQRNLGLNKRTKFLGQLIVAVTFVVLSLEWSGVSTKLSFTRFSSTSVDLGHIGWGIFAVIVIVATANAVNLTDGLDGLASGSSVFNFSCLAIIGYWQYRHFNIYHIHPALDLALCATALAGSCAGFLWWNAAPAKIFMGDTGSLAIGTGLATICLSMNLDLLLPLLGGLFVIVTLSVIIQIISFRLFHRRVFKMAPLHHHFELIGWPETTVIVRFWIIAGLCTALALGIFYADFVSLGLVS
jgi:phospho-N-acetylmuramoyl-pentapeptide-transferase